MGFLEDLGDTTVGLLTAGQCTGSGCGGKHKAYDLGDSMANTFTFGRCDGSGCEGDHAERWTPIQTVFGDGKEGQNPMGLDPDTMKVLMTYAMLGIGGIILLNIVLDLLFKLI